MVAEVLPDGQVEIGVTPAAARILGRSEPER